MPGGVLVVQDHVAPDDEKDAEYVEAFERLRDPSHVRALSAAEWRGTFMDAGLIVEDERFVAHDDNFIPWMERLSVPTDAQERLTDYARASTGGRQSLEQSRAQLARRMPNLPIVIL